MANLSKAITEGWLYSINRAPSPKPSNSPNYWSPDASTLLTTSHPLSLTLGTGTQILNTILAKCSLRTAHELLIVTCFWAPSPSQAAIASLLLSLSGKALSQSRQIHVRICFSSRSIVQKLFQTSSLDGKVYLPEEWAGLGLPSPEEMRGLELEVKSVFVRPFSVMHPKFILVDRELAFMPSCNVSWENWFEGCIEMRGGIAEKLFDFWVAFWAQGKTNLPVFLPHGETPSASSPPLPPPEPEPNTAQQTTLRRLPTQTFFSHSPSPIQTILLPSPHNPNPQFLIFTTPPPPPTPLNLFLLQALALAQSSIYIQTPNITSFPLLSAVRSALTRGVDIHLVTSSRLMILEQLVTAGTVTEFEMWRLRRWYRHVGGKGQESGRGEEDVDLERGQRGLGRLKIGYYHPREGVVGDEEPVQSHLKLVVVDEEITVLGSGNMDRASWYTSQELGVAFFSKEVASTVRRDVDEALEGRVDYICQL